MISLEVLLNQLLTTVSLGDGYFLNVIFALVLTQVGWMFSLGSPLFLKFILNSSPMCQCAFAPNLVLSQI